MAERSPEFKAKSHSFYLPIPRAQKINYADDLADRELGNPENLVDCLRDDTRILIRLSRSYPSQALSWSLAHALIRQQLNDRVVLPYVIQGDQLNPPKGGIEEAVPRAFYSAGARSEFSRVVIIEEPLFHSRNRMKFLTEEIAKTDAYVMVITKAEDNVSSVDDFIKDNGFKEYELAPVSFSETAFFLEKTFDMPAREAEAVAIRLDDTFRKFHLDAHPTYFAGIQEETLAALINANKRAELIQLAVDALLTMIVAADRSTPPLSRTTRERFLRVVVLDMANGEMAVNDQRLLDLATTFLNDGLLPTPAPDFLRPFFEIGLLYRIGGKIYVTHPYLESYFLAQALRDDPSRALKYFDPAAASFNYYAFDLYCELGPCSEVVAQVTHCSRAVLQAALNTYRGDHIYLDRAQRLTALSSPNQIGGLTAGLMSLAEKMEKPEQSGGEVRSEKQRILDARRYVRTQVGRRSPSNKDELPFEVRTEFTILDGLARALAICATAIGSGSESLSGYEKVELAHLVLDVGEKFADVWTRNRLRTDFGQMRNDVLADENIWSVIEELDLQEFDFDQVKHELEMIIHSYEMNMVLDPMGRILAQISSAAGVRVLGPVLDQVNPTSPIQRIMKSSWMMEVDPERGRNMLKEALSSYNGSPLMRIVLASHFLWRVFWHHYKTAGARHFVNSARRALRPLSLVPSKKRLEYYRQGANAGS